MGQSPQYVTFPEACEAIGIKLQTGYNQRSENRFPLRVRAVSRRKLLVLQSEIDKFLDKRDRAESRRAVRSATTPAQKKSRAGRPRRQAA